MCPTNNGVIELVAVWEGDKIVQRLDAEFRVYTMVTYEPGKCLDNI